MTRRTTLIGILGGLSGCVGIPRQKQEPEWSTGKTPELSGIESVRYQAYQLTNSDTVRYKLRLVVDSESELKKIDFHYESPTGNGRTVNTLKPSGGEVTFTAVNAPIFSLIGYDDTEKNSIDWMWNVDVWFLCGNGGCSLAWKGRMADAGDGDE